MPLLLFAPLVIGIVIVAPSPWQPYVGYDATMSRQFATCAAQLSPSLANAEPLAHCLADAGDAKAAESAAFYAARRLMDVPDRTSNIDIVARLQSYGSSLPRVQPTPQPQRHCAASATPTAKGQVRGGSGSAAGVITYQYNNFVGTKGDTGAAVYLLPQPMRPRIQSEDLWSLTVTEGRGLAEPSCAKKYHVLDGKVDGFGNVSFDQVPSGRYYVLIVSSQTHRAYWDPFSDSELENIGPMVDPKVTTTELNVYALLRFSKFAIEDVTVRPNAIAHFSHDFGNTAF